MINFEVIHSGQGISAFFWLSLFLDNCHQFVKRTWKVYISETGHQISLFDEKFVRIEQI